jgi:hypothetical protein
MKFSPSAGVALTLFKCGKGCLAAHLNKRSLLLWPVGFGKQAEHARNVSYCGSMAGGPKAPGRPNRWRSRGRRTSVRWKTERVRQGGRRDVLPVARRAGDGRVEAAAVEAGPARTPDSGGGRRSSSSPLTERTKRVQLDCCGAPGIRRLLTVNSCIKVRLDLQADKFPVVVKGPFFPRVVNPRYRIRGTMCNARIQSSKAR